MKESIFSPHSIAVIGASPNAKKIGHQVLKNIINGGYSGKIFPINNDPKVKKVLGLKNYSSVVKVKNKIDLAIIIVPARFVLGVLEECGKKKIAGVVIISAGFREVGGDGIILEKELIETAKKYNIRMLGPNCLGFIDAQNLINASFAADMPRAGNVAVVSQSGAVCTAILDWALASNIGFSRFYSLGNKADINETDLFSDLARDPQTKVIIAYLESIASGVRFRKITEKLTLNKPLIILKAGTSQKGAEAISSHTGSLAGSDEAVTALFKQCGIIRASSLEDLFDWAEAFSLLKLPKGPKTAIITNAGGPGVMTTDALTKSQLALAALSSQTKAKLKKVLPPAANTHNPIDLIGDADAIRFKVALEIIGKDQGVDSIIILLTPQTSTQIMETSKIISEHIKKSSKTIVPVYMGGRRVMPGIKLFEKNQMAVFTYPERAVDALSKITFCSSCKSGLGKIYPPKILKITQKDLAATNNLIAKYSKKNALIAGPQADKILSRYNIPVLKSALVTNSKQAARESKKIGYPVVFKIASPDIVHKSDVGGVVVGIKNEVAAAAAFRQIIRSVKKNKPLARIDGILIYEMASNGTSYYIGAKRDPVLGPVIGFGLGGIYIEILRDVTFRLAPLSLFDINSMIDELKSKSIILGARGKSPLDKKAIVDTLIKVSNLMVNHPKISELDINPLLLSSSGCLALDNRIIVK